MSMQRGGGRRLAGADELYVCRRAPTAIGAPILCIALSLAAAGCGSIGPMVGMPAQAGGTSISFESIDGPPPEIFHRFFRDLNEEAAAHRIAVVPAGGEASYRVRSYLAAHSKGGATSIAWAWDVYDAELHRAFRLGGEESVGSPAHRDPGGREWAAADEALLRRIAHAGVEQLLDLTRTTKLAEAAPIR